MRKLTPAELAAIPRFQCFKQVRALRIQHLVIPAAPIGTRPVNAFAYFGAFRSLELSGEFIAKHKPEVGGYLVFYEDGYMSYSPQVAFEAGYRQLAGDDEADLVLKLRKIQERASDELVPAFIDIEQLAGDCLAILAMMSRRAYDAAKDARDEQRAREAYKVGEQCR